MTRPRDSPRGALAVLSSLMVVNSCVALHLQVGQSLVWARASRAFEERWLSTRGHKTMTTLGAVFIYLMEPTRTLPSIKVKRDSGAMSARYDGASQLRSHLAGNKFTSVFCSGSFHTTRRRMARWLSARALWRQWRGNTFVVVVRDDCRAHELQAQQHGLQVAV